MAAIDNATLNGSRNIGRTKEKDGIEGGRVRENERGGRKRA